MSNHRMTHAERAAEQLEIAAIYKATLDDLVDQPQSENAKIADAHRGIGQALKIAEVHSNLAIAEAVRESSFPALPGADFTTEQLDPEVGRRIVDQVNHYSRESGRGVTL